MNFLFVHRSGLGQYRAMARWLARSGHNIISIAYEKGDATNGIRRLRYSPLRTSPRLATSERAILRGWRNGRAVAEAAMRLKAEGFEPALMLGHTGWGEILCLKDVWPDRPLLGNFEFWRGARAPAGEFGFDPEFLWPERDAAYYRARNSAALAGFAVVDHGHTATEYQLASYPARYRDAISVIHEGVDTGLFRPDAAARVRLGDRLFQPGDEVITYCARALEPHRGFHMFMRALPAILRKRPAAHALIIGHGGNCYSPPPANHRTYAEQLMQEIEGSTDRSRIHFLGFLPPEQYRAVLRISAAHVYLSYPFVLSWSLIEAMATGCAIFGSRTAPVEEVIRDSENGILVDFFDHEDLADRICDALAHPRRMGAMRQAARQTTMRRFDFETVCRPAHLRLYAQLLGRELIR